MQNFELQAINHLCPEGKGVAGYQEAISHTFGPMVMESSGNVSNAWKVNRLPLRSLVFSHIKYDGLVHARVPKDATSAADKNIVLMCIEQGVVEQKLANSYSKFESGMLVMFNMGKKLEIWQELPVDVLSMTVPTHSLARQCADIEKYCGMPIPETCGAASILRDMLKGVFRESENLNVDDYQSISTAFGGMISSVFHNDSLIENTSTILQQYHERIVDIIEAEIQNPDLSPQLIADQLGVSRSYLFSITRKAGFSISSQILETRLNYCKEVLLDRSWSGRSITDIAFTWGFKELSHFSRRFTQKFGVCPKLYREQNLSNN